MQSPSSLHDRQPFGQALRVTNRLVSFFLFSPQSDGVQTKVCGVAPHVFSTWFLPSWIGHMLPAIVFLILPLFNNNGRLSSIWFHVFVQAVAKSYNSTSPLPRATDRLVLSKDILMMCCNFVGCKAFFVSYSSFLSVRRTRYFLCPSVRWQVPHPLSCMTPFVILYRDRYLSRYPIRLQIYRRH